MTELNDFMVQVVLININTLMSDINLTSSM